MILSNQFNVIKYRFEPSKKLFRFIWEMVKISINSLLIIPKCEVIYIWFADYHSFIPVLFGKIFGKKTVVVVGGYDAVHIPMIDFGVFRRNDIRAFCARYSLSRANFVFPVDESLVEDVNYFADPSGIGISIGIKHFVKHIRGKIVVIPTGYDPEKWKNKCNKKTQTVVTIGGASDEQTYRRKGLDFLIEAAKYIPDKEIHIIGLHGKMEQVAKSAAPENVVFHGYVDCNKLPELISRHKVFAQFSLSEGLPNTLCEAMLCECIPVGSSANGIPKGIGNTGFVLERKDPKMAAGLLKTALEAENDFGKLARFRIIDHFTIDKRQKKILDTLNS